MPGFRPDLPAVVAIALVGSLLAPPSATAHFVLQSPASWRTQDSLGYPQKEGPCGNEGSSATTGVITTFSPGQTITITLDETIFHPGHYRVALALNDASELPESPGVIPGTTDCGSASIMKTPVFPVLADGMLPHTNAFSGPQSFQVTLPSDVTCARCTLQVLEFMSSHDAPCFYHHCAEISIDGGASSCAGDEDCDDASVCTADHCDVVASSCEHVDTVTATCDDGDTCTSDVCNPTSGCIATTITLADVDAGFLGVLEAPACAGESLPAIVSKLFAQADALVVRAADDLSKARRFLGRAAKHLRKTAKKVAKAERRRVSAECGAGLAGVLENAQSKLGCVLGSS